MREFIDIIDGILMERIETHTIRGRDVAVLTNPSRTETTGFLNRYKALRGCALWNGDLMIFPAATATHGDIYDGDDQYPVMIMGDTVTYRVDSDFDPDAIAEFGAELMERLPLHRGLKRALGEFRVHIDTPDEEESR